MACSSFLLLKGMAFWRWLVFWRWLAFWRWRSSFLLGVWRFGVCERFFYLYLFFSTSSGVAGFGVGHYLSLSWCFAPSVTPSMLLPSLLLLPDSPSVRTPVLGHSFCFLYSAATRGKARRTKQGIFPVHWEGASVVAPTLSRALFLGRHPLEVPLLPYHFNKSFAASITILSPRALLRSLYVYSFSCRWTHPIMVHLVDSPAVYSAAECIARIPRECQLKLAALGVAKRRARCDEEERRTARGQLVSAPPAHPSLSVSMKVAHSDADDTSPTGSRLPMPPGARRTSHSRSNV